MELSISDNMNQSKETDVDEFIKELNETVEKNEKKSKDKTDEEPKDMFGLTETDYRRAKDEENFAPQLAKELGLSEEDLDVLRDKIDNYLKEYSKSCGVISYQGYDMDKNQYYDDWFENGKRNRTKLTEQEFAQGYTMGWFYRLTQSESDPSIFNGSLFEEVKDAIKFSIEEQLSEGVSVKDINLFKLENDIKNNQYLKPLYDKFNENENNY